MPTPEYSLQFDPIREQYIASNGEKDIRVRKTIGYALVKKVEMELGNPQDETGLQQIGEITARRIFEFVEKFS